MFIAVVPFFDYYMSVKAYTVSSQKAKNLMIEDQTATALDGSMRSIGLDVIQNIGLEAIAGEMPVFVPVSNIALLSAIEKQCTASPDKIVFVINNSVQPIDMYINRINELISKGYSIALENVNDFITYKPILSIIQYVFLNNRKTDVLTARHYLTTNHPYLKQVVTNIMTIKQFHNIRAGNFHMYEGMFYRIPITQGKSNVAPLKINYVQLLNLINNDSFEISSFSKIVRQDISLSISLLELVNSLGLVSEVTSINHAAAMLGQKELKKWVMTAVVKQLCLDKPNEITKVSLLRAKFAESLAPCFEMAISAPDLFMLGLFSIIDIALEMPMEKAVEAVKVPNNIRDALVDDKGRYAPVLQFIKKYEGADWQEVSRYVILYNLEVPKATNAYLSGLKWYSGLLAVIKKIS